MRAAARLDDVRPELVPLASGSTRSRLELQGLRRLPDAAADAGLRDARDAEHRRAVRVEARGTTSPTLGPRSPEFWHILIEAKKLAYTDLLEVQRRSAVRRTSRSNRLTLQVVRRVALRPRSTCSTRAPVASTTERAPGLHCRQGAGRHRLPRRPLTAGATWCRSSTASTTTSDRRSRCPGYGFPMNDRGVVLLARPVVAERRRPAQAAVHDDHPGVRDEERRSRCWRSATWAATSRPRPRRRRS